MDYNITKKCSKSLVIRTGKTTDRMALNFFPETILLINMDCYEGILNQFRIDGIVNDHSSSCNL